ncbi:hypothetical protein [Paenibacillus elgii]|uniref:hypothetical protein n=1 Tax=Paenibacillus elgii TaxID=189691 RepID=UPI000248D3B5|nr:hypothetical protein [Paenibacillus elgii]
MGFQKRKKEVQPWRQNILSHHRSRPSAADRNEFPAKVVKELIAESGGLCQCGCGRPGETTHHVMPRGRSGRGVKTNGMRLSGECHDRIQTDESELQHWIEEWERRYGPHFWYDEQDWAEHHKRIESERAAAAKQRERERIAKCLVEIVTNWRGQALTKKHARIIDQLIAQERPMELLKKLFDIQTEGPGPLEDKNQTAIEDYIGLS